MDQDGNGVRSEWPGVPRGLGNTEAQLQSTVAEVARILRPGGAGREEPPRTLRGGQRDERSGTFRGIKQKWKPGLGALAPCVTSFHPETDLPEAKQLRLCLLSQSGLRY